ncbi:MAG: PQQ-binding-like beta-propeller repeat protein [Planctomycetes bacterium]|nr:PQQ-binding-like beta-propeller repeat protein [Planctomycetota bacterium]
MSSLSDPKLAEEVVRRGLVTASDLKRAFVVQTAAGSRVSLAEVLVSLGLLSNEQLAAVAAAADTDAAAGDLRLSEPAGGQPPSLAPLPPLPPLAAMRPSVDAGDGGQRAPVTSTTAILPAPTFGPGPVPSLLPFRPHTDSAGSGERHRPDVERPTARTAALSPSPEQNPAMPMGPGKKFGKYLILSELGRGGMGVVYKVLDESLGKERALKVLLSGSDATSHEIGRFLREVKASARLSHPGIVAVHEADEVEGKKYFTMELVEGQSLDRVLDDPSTSRLSAIPVKQSTDPGVLQRRYALAPLDAARLMEQVAQALHYAHGEHVVHRDIKPGNVILDTTGRPRVMDFGLAKIMDPKVEGYTRLTRSGVMMGTMAYMSPEQANGEIDGIDARTDIYALGAVLYEMLTGRTPHSGNEMEMLVAIMDQEPVAPRKLLETVPRDLETITLKCLEKHPERRYATAGELAEDLGRWREGKPILARPASAAYRVWKWAVRNPGLAGLVVLGPLFLLYIGLTSFGPSILEINSEPPGATVFLDAHDRHVTTPVEGIWVWPGDRSIRLKKEGYDDAEINVHLAAFIRQNGGTLKLTKDSGSVEIEVEPANASLEVSQGDKRFELERTERPGRFRKTLKVGLYRLVVSAPDHKPEEATLEVRPDAVTTRPFRLRHRSGAIRVTTTLPGVTMKVFSAPAGTKPASVRPIWKHEVPRNKDFLQISVPIEKTPVPTGTYRFIYEKKGCLPWERISTVEEQGGDEEAPGLSLNVPLRLQQIWAFEARGAVNSTPALDDLDGDGILDAVFGSDDKRLYAVSGRDGRPLWSVETQGEVQSSPALGDLDGDGVPDVVAGSEDGRVYALSGRDGRRLWTVPTRGKVRSSPALGDLNGDGVADVVVGSLDRKVYALSGVDGRELWTFATGDAVESSPALARLDGDAIPDVVIGSDDNSVYALSGKDGARLWSQATEGDVVSSPALADLNGDECPDVVVGSRDGTLRAFSGRNGVPFWKHAFNGKVESSPAVADLNGDGCPDFVVGTEDGAVHALSGRDGSPLWTHETYGKVGGGPALGDLDGDGVADVLVRSWDGQVLALRGTDGEVLWDFEAGKWIASSPALGDLNGDGVPDVLVADGARRLLALAGRDAGPLWAFETKREVESSAALADLDRDGVLDVVVGSYDKQVYALTGLDGACLWSAPTEADYISATVLKDLNGDQVPDVVMQVPPRTKDAPKGLYVFSGVDGRRLKELETDERLALFEARADLNGDGVEDLVDRAHDRGLEATSGKDGKQLWLMETDHECKSHPALRDLNGDGVPDVVVGLEDYRVCALSGKDGTRLWTSEDEALVLSTPAFGDLNGDGVPDVVVGSDDEERYGEKAGSVHAISGKDGRTLWLYETRGKVLSSPKLADMDGDGVLDVVVGSHDRRVHVISGKSGACLWSFETGAEVLSSPALGDLNLDGLLDVVVGSRDGQIYAIPGRKGVSAAPKAASTAPTGWRRSSVSRPPHAARLRGILERQDLAVGVEAGSALVTDDAVLPAERGAVRFEMARLLLEERKQPEALAALAEAAKELPRSWEVWLALCAEGRGKDLERPPGEGPARLARALLLDPVLCFAHVRVSDEESAIWYARRRSVWLPAGLAREAARLLGDEAARGPLVQELKLREEAGRARGRDEVNLEEVTAEVSRRIDLARGVALLLARDPAAALPILECPAKACWPPDPNFLKFYGLALLRAGRAVEAVRVLEGMSRFTAPFPERDEWMAEARQALREQEGR